MIGPKESPDAAVQEPLYERLYETHASTLSDEDAVGDGDFDWIGQLEMRLLQLEGLTPEDTLMDFGCGSGRMSVHAIPWLNKGHYIGVDISHSMLSKAQHRVGMTTPGPTCRVSWVQQSDTTFAFPDHHIDYICVFSVFTHMEHEDMFKYLQDARRVVRPGGRLILSCLPMNLEVARDIFIRSAEDNIEHRWSKIRNVTTSTDLVETIAKMAGWIPKHWYAGNEPNISYPGTTELYAFGQSVCVLQAPS